MNIRNMTATELRELIEESEAIIDYLEEMQTEYGDFEPTFEQAIKLPGNNAVNNL